MHCRKIFPVIPAMAAIAALAWMADSSAAELAKGRQMFQQGTTPACAVCHTLQDAGTTGTIGPNLDELKPDADRVAKAIREGLGVMPAFTDLSDDEVQLLAEYVSTVAK